MSELVLVVYLKTHADTREQFLKLALDNAQATRDLEPGCLQFDVVSDPDDPDRIMFYEVYRDKAAFEKHQQSAHFKDYLERAVPLLASRERAFFKRLAP